MLDQFEPTDSALEGIEDLSLDDLWKEVAPLAKKTMHERVKAAEQSLSDTYTNPANWRKERGIVLIHEPTQTLLGKFREFRHIRIPECRRLVRDDSVPHDAIEYVTGKQWVTETIIAPALHHTQEPAILDINLHTLGYTGVEIPVTIHRSHGYLSRVTLDLPATFAGEGQQYLQLPAGLNILPHMKDLP